VFRRRRIGAALFLGAVLITLAALVAGLMARSGAGGSVAIRTEPAPGAVVNDLAAYGSAHVDPPPGSVYVVQPGDTLWSIARALVPAGDVRAEVDDLQTLNGSAALQAGQRLALAPTPGS
jgi:Tfp pilus assembly protein FimV